VTLLLESGFLPARSPIPKYSFLRTPFGVAKAARRIDPQVTVRLASGW